MNARTFWNTQVPTVHRYVAQLNVLPDRYSKFTSFQLRYRMYFRWRMQVTHHCRTINVSVSQIVTSYPLRKEQIYCANSVPRNARKALKFSRFLSTFPHYYSCLQTNNSCVNIALIFPYCDICQAIGSCFPTVMNCQERKGVGSFGRRLFGLIRPACFIFLLFLPF